MSFHPIKLASIISLAIAFTGSSSPIWTQAKQTKPPSPPPTGTPGGQTQRGGTRPGDSKCPNVDTGLIAFTPAVAKTITEPRTFWFYVPYVPQDVDSFSFEIVNEQNQTVQPRIKKPLSGTPGFISLSLTSASPQLEIGKRYRWYFSIYCDRQNKTDRISLEGEVQRIAPSSDSIAGTSRERIARYRERGYWYDAFSVLAELRRASPNDSALKADWDNLLEQYNLSNIASKPFASCCSLDNP